MEKNFSGEWGVELTKIWPTPTCVNYSVDSGINVFKRFTII